MNDQKKDMLIKLLVQLYNFLRGYHNNVVNVNGINRAVVMQIALCLCCCRHFTDCVCLFCPRAVTEYLQTVQATSVLACVFAILALFVFVAQLFTLPKGQRFTFTGILQLIACK